MKTTHVFLLFLLLIPFGVTAQVNLVPNPSFEDTLYCPQFYSEVGTACKDWMVFKESPDYMHTCNPILANDLTLGKTPHTGEAFVGFLTYGITTPDIAREQLGVKLVSPLVIGQKYFVSFFVSMAYVSQICNIATNNIGVLFTTYTYYDPMLEMPNFNFSHINEASIISESENWVNVSGSFIADSAYSYMIIGNFYDDIFTDTLNLPYTVAQQRAYYCIDDVCVSTDSLYAHTWTTLSIHEQGNNNILIFPNPATGYFQISIDYPMNKIILYDYTGNKVMEDQTTGNQHEVNTNGLSSGIYLLHIETNNTIIKKQIIINQ
jgi:hypothetical protein